MTGPTQEQIAYAQQVTQALGRGGHLGAVVIPVPSLGTATRGFADEYNNVFTRVIDLTNARTMERLFITGNFFWVIDATSQGALASMRFNSQANSAIPASLGLTIGGFRFSSAYITNAAQAGESITILYGVQEPGTNLYINNPSQIIANVDVQRPGTLIDNAAAVVINAGTNGLIIAANPDRYRVTIQHAGSVNSLLNIAADNAIASQNEGVQLVMGESITLHCTDDIWGRASVANCTIRWLEESA